MKSNSNEKDDVIKLFNEAINSHGYGFQYSILQIAKELFAQNKSKWIFEVSEFPVHTQGFGTRIDFVLLNRENPFVYMLAECKRVNPAFSHWCFAKSPYIMRNLYYDPIVFEQIYWDDYKSEKIYPIVTGSHKQWKTLENAYHIGVVVNSPQKGDRCPKANDRNAIENAATQICKGFNGFTNYLASNKQLAESFYQPRGKYASMFIFPVIFTTAQLWVSEVELNKADIETGELDLSNSTFTEVDWVHYQYHQSPGLKHNFVSDDQPDKLGESMRKDYIRTITIVKASAIEKFLTKFSNIEWSLLN